MFRHSLGTYLVHSEFHAADLCKVASEPRVGKECMYMYVCADSEIEKERKRERDVQILYSILSQTYKLFNHL